MPTLTYSALFLQLQERRMNIKGLVTTLSAMCATLFTPVASALPLGTVEIENVVAGTPVKIPVSLDLNIATVNTGIQVVVVADMNLGELQSKVDAIAKSFPMPRDNCPGYGQHVLPTVESVALKTAGNTAAIDARVNVVIWDCQAGVPLGGTTVRWETRCVTIIRRICTDVPVKVEPKPGPDIKNILIREGLAGEVRLVLAVPDGKSIELKPVSTTVQPRGDVGRFFNNIAGIFNSNLSDVAQKEIRKIVDAGTLRQALPKEILAFNPVINSATFQTTPDGKLGVRASFEALISPQQLTEWIQASIAK
jgi:hypothetical protein